MIRTPLLKIALLISLACVAAAPAWAQWTTPTIDGHINSGEYGNNNQLNNAGNTGQTWYMTWDATNLYVGIANANLNEGLVLYVGRSANHHMPNSNGNLTGFNYDGANFSSLPFRATFVTYVKNGYREYRNSNGGGGWGSQTAYAGQYADDGGTVRAKSPSPGAPSLAEEFHRRLYFSDIWSPVADTSMARRPPTTTSAASSARMPPLRSTSQS